MNSGKKLTGPVYDFTSQKVYVGDSGGLLSSVTTSGTVTQSGTLGIGVGVVDAPLVDSTAEKVYVFVGDNAAGTASAVVQLDISSGNITSGTTGTAASLGTSNATTPLYDGMFDNNYFSSSNATGNLYTCGNTGGNPTLYQVSISSNVMSTSPVTGPVLANSSGAACSPLQEIFNSPTDWLFASVPSSSCGASGTTLGGCVMSFNITSGSPTIGPWLPSTSYAANAEVVDTNGNLQKCTANCTGAGGATTGTTAPTWATVSGNTTTDGASTKASAVGTVSSTSGLSATGTYSVTIGSLTVNGSNPVAASQTGTVSALPSAAGSITIKNGSNTLTLTTNATAAQASGTFSGQTTSGAVIVTVGGNTITLASSSTGQMTFNGTPATGSTIMFGGITYTFTGSLSSGSAMTCTILNTNEADAETGLVNAINSSSTSGTDYECKSNGDASPNPDVTATGPVSNMITLTNTSASSVTFSSTGTTNITLPGTIPPLSNSCSGSAPTFTGTFIPSATVGTEASAVVSAITACTSPGVGATSSAGKVTFTATSLGSSITVSDSTSTASNFGSFTSTAGTDGSNACSGSAPTFTGTFSTAGGTTANVASNIATAIGTGTCPSGLGVSASAAASIVTLKDATPGTGGNGGTLTPTTVTNGFKWNGTALANGSDGTTTAGSTFAFWSVSAPVSQDTLASNLFTALNGETIASGTTVTVTNPGGTTNVFTATDNTAGPAGNSIAVSDVLPAFAWSYNSNSTTTLQGGNSPLTWTNQGVSNGQTTAAQATGTSGIIIDNVSASAGASSIYFGTLSGTGATKSAVKMTQAGLQ